MYYIKNTYIFFEMKIGQRDIILNQKYYLLRKLDLDFGD